MQQLTPWSRVLEKLVVAQLIKIFRTSYWNQRFITMFTRAHHWSMSWARWTYSPPSYSVSWRSIL